MAIFSLIKSSFLSLTLISTTFFFLLPKYPKYPSISDETPHRSLRTTTIHSCSSIPPSNGLINYFSLHYCFFDQNLFHSIASLSLLLVLYFYILIKTAQTHFSTITTKLSQTLNLSPSMGAVTLLALGNGAPDVFASVAAVRAGNYRTGFGAILSAGTFVSSFVVGFVAIYAAPFSVDPVPFVRDVLFYLIGAFFLFYVYLSGEIFVWQAVGFIGFYVFFVGFVFWMDFGGGQQNDNKDRDKYRDVERVLVNNDCEIGSRSSLMEFKEEKEKLGFSFAQVYGLISKVWEAPVSFLLKLTIPQSALSEWNRFYMSANIAFCPLALLYACNSFMPFNHPIAFLIPNTHFPLWLVVFSMSSSLAFLHYLLEKEPQKTEPLPVVIIAFVMSVFWISTIAGELLNCLAALGVLLKLPSAILGLTVLAWGNSVGDLVADVAVAKAGHPEMAMAGCFAGPMFNMLVGLGTALVIQTVDVYPLAFKLHFHVGIVVAFVFLLLGLMGSLLVITWSRFRVPRLWGFFLVGLYVVFTAVSIIIAKFS